MCKQRLERERAREGEREREKRWEHVSHAETVNYSFVRDGPLREGAMERKREREKEGAIFQFRLDRRGRRRRKTRTMLMIYIGRLATVCGELLSRVIRELPTRELGFCHLFGLLWSLGLSTIDPEIDGAGLEGPFCK